MVDGATDMARPGGDVYDWYRRGQDLLARGNPAAAAAVLQHAVAAEPASRELRETLARAQYAAGAYEHARDNFAAIVAAAPSDDYAHFGLGLAHRRVGELDRAAEHLALAAAMRPDNRHYGSALNSVRVARGES
jgi:tetratricopeptide (TPR) repeat protein